jgi:hypothetical protein
MILIRHNQTRLEHIWYRAVHKTQTVDKNGGGLELQGRMCIIFTTWLIYTPWFLARVKYLQALLQIEAFRIKSKTHACNVVEKSIQSFMELMMIRPLVTMIVN